MAIKTCQHVQVYSNFGVYKSQFECFLSHSLAQVVSTYNGDEVPNETTDEQTVEQSPVDTISTKRFYGKLDVIENKTPCKSSHNNGKKNKKKPASEQEIDSPIGQIVETKGILKLKQKYKLKKNNILTDFTHCFQLTKVTQFNVASADIHHRQCKICLRYSDLASKIELFSVFNYTTCVENSTILTNMISGLSFFTLNLQRTRKFVL